MKQGKHENNLPMVRIHGLPGSQSAQTKQCRRPHTPRALRLQVGSRPVREMRLGVVGEKILQDAIIILPI